MRAIGEVLIDGRAVAQEAAVVSVFDIGFQRGYGCFEAIRSYGGVPFHLDAHLERLAGSAAGTGLPLPDPELLTGWVTDRARHGGDCVVRVLVSGGDDVRSPGVGSRVIVFAESLPPAPTGLRVSVRPAPWHAGGEPWELAGAKTLSYGPNVAAALAARRDGFDDALLVTRDGAVLEGPTFSIAWVTDGRIETPTLDLGILESITRRVTLQVASDLGLEAAEGAFGVERVLGADEVLAMSTVKEVMPVLGIDDRAFVAGPVTADLAAGFRGAVESATRR